MNTAEKARHLWCPMARQTTNHEVAANRSDDCNCLAELCGAWRWSQDLPRRKFIFHADQAATVQPDARPGNIPMNWEFIPFDPSDGDPATWVEPESDAQSRRAGYCGLAGRHEFS